jgi:DNA polymerase-3 subunit alpha
MAALLSSEKDNTEKVVKYIEEAKRIAIEILPPSVNESEIDFSPKDKTIRFGLGAIKGIGEGAIGIILETRKKSKFTSIEQFLSSIDSTKVNKRVIEALIKSGSFDNMGHNRRTMFENLEKLVETMQHISKAKKSATNSFFDEDELSDIKIDIQNREEFPIKELLQHEKDSIGFYISGHPLSEYKTQMDSIAYTLSSDIELLQDKSEVLFIGFIEDIKEKISKKGNKFGIISLMDYHGNIELTVFEDMLKQLATFEREKPVVLKVNINKNSDGTKLSTKKILSLEDARSEKVEKKLIESLNPILIDIGYINNTNILQDITNTIHRHRGSRELKISIRVDNKVVDFDSSIKVSTSIIDELKHINNIYISELSAV